MNAPTRARTHRNGNRARLLSTKAGDVELSIPKLREGSFYPSLAGAAPADRPGVVGGDHGSVRARRVDPQGRRSRHRARASTPACPRARCRASAPSSTPRSTEFRDRRLDHIEFPYVFLDATYVKAHEGARVVSKAIIVATGVAADGNREVLGLAVGDSEDKAFWTSFLRSLRQRGLAGVRLVISDAHEGLRDIDRQGHARRRVATMPSALLAQRAGQGPQGQRGDGRRRDPHDLRSTRRRRRRRPARLDRREARPPVPRGRDHVARRRR